MLEINSAESKHFKKYICMYVHMYLCICVSIYVKYVSLTYLSTEDFRGMHYCSLSLEAGNMMSCPYMAFGILLDQKVEMVKASKKEILHWLRNRDRECFLVPPPDQLHIPWKECIHISPTGQPSAREISKKFLEDLLHFYKNEWINRINHALF